MFGVEMKGVGGVAASVEKMNYDYEQSSWFVAEALSRFGCEVVSSSSVYSFRGL